MTATGTGTNTDADSAVLNLTSLHGDVIASIPATDEVTYPTSFNDYTAFGAPINRNTTPATPPAPYGWEGANQRSNHAQTGIIMMGVRQYNPVTGTFLTQDPIPGGNANAYTYPTDPLGGEDLSGMARRKKPVKQGSLHIYAQRTTVAISFKGVA
ncbi:MAG: RHS repeat-associated core domain-containing protein [Candidatus Nanopelagicales bacterium]